MTTLAPFLSRWPGTFRPAVCAVLLSIMSWAGGARAAVPSGSFIQEAYAKASNTGGGDLFGSAIAVSGDTLVVGAPNEASAAAGINGDGSDNNALLAGAVYVFVRSDTNWVQQAYLKASNAQANDQFGIAVAISGDFIVVGAYLEDGGAVGVNGPEDDNSAINSGAAYVFVRQGTNWTQQAYLKASNTGAEDFFGGSVAISGTNVVIGAFGEASNGTGGDQDNSAPTTGAAYVFGRSGTNWTPQAYLKASNPDAGDFFGYAVGISGSTVVVGAYQEDSHAIGSNGDPSSNDALSSGAAYVFVNANGRWSQQAYLKASNTEAQDQFGLAVAVSADVIVVGAPQEGSSASGVNGDQTNNNLPFSGASYVFARRGTNWTQQAYLKASNTGFFHSFGTAVAASGDQIAMGAPGESTGGSLSGAAYVFTQSGTNWTQSALLKASNAGAGDGFGAAVGLSVGTVVIGARSEDSNATGVNGTGSDPSINFNAGAAYAFNDPSHGLRLQIEPDGGGGYFIRFHALPAARYRLQRTNRLQGPWQDSVPQTVPASGLIEFWDVFPLPGQGFYRAVQP